MGLAANTTHIYASTFRSACGQRGNMPATWEEIHSNTLEWKPERKVTFVTVWRHAMRRWREATSPLFTRYQEYHVERMDESTLSALRCFAQAFGVMWLVDARWSDVEWSGGRSPVVTVHRAGHATKQAVGPDVMISMQLLKAWAVPPKAQEADRFIVPTTKWGTSPATFNQITLELARAKRQELAKTQGQALQGPITHAFADIVAAAPHLDRETWEEFIDLMRIERPDLF